MSETDFVLFEDKFHIEKIDPDGKKFEKVKSEDNVEITLDINIDVYPCKSTDNLTIALAKTINLKGEPDNGIFEPHVLPTLLDHYEYAMHGKLFKYDQQENQNVSIYISFGGLMMNIQGSMQLLRNLVPENLSEGRIFCLIRKTD